MESGGRNLIKKIYIKIRGKQVIRKLLKSGKVEESLSIAMLLALVGGYLDIYSYLARGKVFANTQTGNLVLLGYSIAQGNWNKVFYYLMSIVAFTVGVIVAKIIELKFKGRKYFSWIHLALGIEIAALLMVMFIPKGEWNVLANVTVSFVCGLQVQGFRKVNGKAYSTIMFTGNLKNLADHLSRYWLTKDQEALEGGLTYLGIIVMFIIGGWLGALTTMEYDIRAVGLASIILAVVFIQLYVARRNPEV